jgi:TolB protein
MQALAASIVVCLASASCSKSDPLYCSTEETCTAGYTFCDVDGICPASEHIKNTCIPEACWDAGSDQDGGPEGDARGSDAGPACTPLFAYTSATTGSPQDIYIAGPDVVPMRITNSPAANESLPSWSPDNTHLAFGSDADGDSDIYIISITEQTPVNISNSNGEQYGPLWSPDGSLIAFGSQAGEDLDIFVMNKDGSGKTPIAPSGGWDRLRDWSPASDALAFESDRDGNIEIYIVNLDGSGLRNLSNHPVEDYSPDWSPDGSLILFHSGRDGASDIYSIRPDGTGLTNITNDPDTPQFGGQWSPDGTLIAFAEYDGPGLPAGDFVIRVMQADGTDGVEIMRTPFSSGFQFDWAANSSQLVVQVLINDNYDLLLVEADGSASRNVTLNAARADRSAAWNHCVSSN